MTELAAYIGAVSVAGPGIGSWQDSRTRWAEDWIADPDWRPQPQSLGARQARRLSQETLLALVAAEGIVDALGPEAGWVFASSTGEGTTLNDILAALCTEEMLIQPVKFQNAVHNAAAGQWTIARGLHGPVTSIAAFDDTAGTGLLKALLQVAVERIGVGLICFDGPLPPPLHDKRPMDAPLAAGFALTPDPGPGTIGRITASVGFGDPSVPRSTMGRALSAIGNPVAALLPLLETLGGAGGSVTLGLSGGQGLHLDVELL